MAWRAEESRHLVQSGTLSPHPPTRFTRGCPNSYSLLWSLLLAKIGSETDDFVADDLPMVRLPPDRSQASSWLRSLVEFARSL